MDATFPGKSLSQNKSGQLNKDEYNKLEQILTSFGMSLQEASFPKR